MYFFVRKCIVFAILSGTFWKPEHYIKGGKPDQCKTIVLYGS